jgi:hypothetical protein
LYKVEVEIPGDVTGILYKKFVESPTEKLEEIRQALVLGGIRLPDVVGTTSGTAIRPADKPRRRRVKRSGDAKQVE